MDRRAHIRGGWLFLLLFFACMTNAESIRAGNREVNVLDYGVDRTGRVDATRTLMRIHSLGRRVYYPNGVYRFNGPTLDFSGGVRFESLNGVVIRNDLSPEPVVVFDDDGRLIGLQQNHLEKNEKTLGGPLPIRDGSLVHPPLSKDPPATSVDLLAHWYNDFGLESRRVNKGSGWIGWYYWTWNFHRAVGDGYDPSRHPLLGFYRGDDPTVFDWQCYWLCEYGVTGVILAANITDPTALARWDRPSSELYWIHELFNHAPNFKRLRYVMWGPTAWRPCTAENQAKIERAWTEVIDRIYLRYANRYVLRIKDRRYPVMFVWDEGALRGVFDNYRGSLQTHAFYKRVARRFQKYGFDGVALFVRHPQEPSKRERERLEEAGVLHFAAYYGNPLSRNFHNYRELVDHFRPPADPHAIVNVVTSHDSHTPHPSHWKCPGSTPDLFRRLLAKAVKRVCAGPGPRVITCYNVAEWAEGGPGLQPNMRDRFGYLQAVRDVLTRTRSSERTH